MGAIQGTAERKAMSRLVSIRVTADEHGVLEAAATCAGMPVARLARVLLKFGLAQLDRANPELDRAIKVSRD